MSEREIKLMDSMGKEPKREPTTITFGFYKGDKVPKEFDSLSIDDKVEITVTGKVTRLVSRKSKGESEWDNKAEFAITQDSVSIKPSKVKAKSLKDAMDEATESRKM
jgi:hypothetical protein